MANIDKVALLNNGKVVGAGRNKDNSNLAPIEATTTASRSYLVGDYLMLQGEFYKVISAIAIGDTLTVGTNIQATNVGNEVSDINDRVSANTIGTEVDLLSYTSSSSPYICQSDGYVALQANISGGVVRANISGISALARYSGSDYVMVFVRKGMEIYISNKAGTVVANFCPLS